MMWAIGVGVWVLLLILLIWSVRRGRGWED